MVSMLALDFLISGFGTGLDWDVDEIFLFNLWMNINRFSNRYFELCSDGNHDNLVTGVQDGVNSGVGKFVADRLGKGFDGDADGIIILLDNNLRLIMMKSLRLVLQ